MSEPDDASVDQLLAVLEQDPLNTAETLRALSRGRPELLVLESVSPLQALVVFATRRPDMPQIVYLWGRERSCCDRFLGRLAPSARYWLSAADPGAAMAARQWAAEVTWQAEEINYTVAEERFHPHPHPEVIMLKAADAAALEGSPRPHVARALSVPPPGQGIPANRFFGVLRGGAWCGDAFCMHVYKDVWVIADVAVAENCRRQGLGKGLVTACTEYVLAQGGRPTYQADLRNEPSRRLCEALGYTPVPMGARFRFELRTP